MLSKKNTKLEFTGERLVPNTKGLEELEMEHTARYIYSSRFVKGKNVLDLGCGTGYGTEVLANTATSVIGIDIDQKTVEWCNSHYKQKNITFKQGNAENFNIHEKSIDIVTCFEVIEHIPKYESMLLNIKKSLKENGILFVSTPNKKNYPKGNPFHVKEFFEEEYIQLLNKFFNNIYIFYQDKVLSNIILSRDNNNKSLLVKENYFFPEWPSLEPEFFFAICSDSEVEILYDQILLTNDRALINSIPTRDEVLKLRKRQKEHEEELENRDKDYNTELNKRDKEWREEFNRIVKERDKEVLIREDIIQEKTNEIKDLKKKFNTENERTKQLQNEINNIKSAKLYRIVYGNILYTALKKLLKGKSK